MEKDSEDWNIKKDGASAGVVLERIVRPDEVKDKIYNFLCEKYSGRKLTPELSEEIYKDLSKFCNSLSDAEKFAMPGRVDLKHVNFGRELGKVDIVFNFDV